MRQRLEVGRRGTGKFIDQFRCLRDRHQRVLMKLQGGWDDHSQTEKFRDLLGNNTRACTGAGFTLKSLSPQQPPDNKPLAIVAAALSNGSLCDQMGRLFLELSSPSSAF